MFFLYFSPALCVFLAVLTSIPGAKGANTPWAQAGVTSSSPRSDRREGDREGEKQRWTGHSYRPHQAR